jgi:hypothetical protein
MKANIIKCSKCKSFIISEEKSSHLCSDKLDNILFDTDGTFSLDGQKWYKWSPPKFKHPNGTPRDSTEPKIKQKYLIIWKFFNEENKFY